MVEFAKKIDCNSAIIMPGVNQPNLKRSTMYNNMHKAFSKALDIAEKNNFTLLLEPLNTEIDHAGFFLNSVEEAVKIIKEFNSPNMKMLYDIYHMQIMQGNVVDTIKKYMDVIGHIHVAGVPERAEPNNCELNYPFIFQKAEEFGYQGWFGLEYFPHLDSTKSLKQQLTMIK